MKIEVGSLVQNFNESTWVQTRFVKTGIIKSVEITGFGFLVLAID